MAPKTNPQNCDTGHCEDHSGMVERDNSMMSWQKGTFALLMFSAGMLSFSVLWQAPNLRADIAREVARLNAKDQELTYEIQNIKKDVSEIKCSMSKKLAARE